MNKITNSGGVERKRGPPHETATKLNGHPIRAIQNAASDLLHQNNAQEVEMISSLRRTVVVFQMPMS
jgi:hypothetical protein